MAILYTGNSEILRDATLVKDDIENQVVSLVFNGDQTAFDEFENSIWRDQVESLKVMVDEFFRTQLQYAGEGTKLAYNIQLHIPGPLWPDGEEDDDRVGLNLEITFVEYVGIAG